MPSGVALTIRDAAVDVGGRELIERHDARRHVVEVRVQPLDQPLGRRRRAVGDGQRPDALARQREGDGAGGAAGAQEQHRPATGAARLDLAQRARETVAVGRMPDEVSLVDDDGVDGVDQARVARHLVEEGQDGGLVRHRDVGAAKAERAQAGDGLADAVGRHRQRHIGEVEPQRGEGRVVHHRRERVRDGIADDADQPRGAADGHVELLSLTLEGGDGRPTRV